MVREEKELEGRREERSRAEGRSKRSEGMGSAPTMKIVFIGMTGYTAPCDTPRPASNLPLPVVVWPRTDLPGQMCVLVFVCKHMVLICTSVCLYVEA